eukprot:345597-Rhodomonas_salina.1
MAVHRSLHNTSLGAHWHCCVSATGHPTGPVTPSRAHRDLKLHLPVPVSSSCHVVRPRRAARLYRVTVTRVTVTCCGRWPRAVDSAPRPGPGPA